MSKNVFLNVKIFKKVNFTKKLRFSNYVGGRRGSIEGGWGNGRGRSSIFSFYSFSMVYSYKSKFYGSLKLQYHAFFCKGKWFFNHHNMSDNILFRSFDSHIRTLLDMVNKSEDILSDTAQYIFTKKNHLHSRKLRLIYLLK